MSRLWVPPRVSQELQAETARFRHELHSQMQRASAVIEDFNRDLKKIDRDLEMFYAPETMDVVGVTPGRYHILKHIPGAPPSILPITGPAGEFVEPTSAVFEKLRQLDLQSSATRHERRRQQEEADRAVARRKAREDEERRDEMKDRYNAAFRASVSMAPGWSQNVSGRKGRR